MLGQTQLYVLEAQKKGDGAAATGVQYSKVAPCINRCPKWLGLCQEEKQQVVKPVRPVPMACW